MQPQFDVLQRMKYIKHLTDVFGRAVSPSVDGLTPTLSLHAI